MEADGHPRHSPPSGPGQNCTGLAARSRLGAARGLLAPVLWFEPTCVCVDEERAIRLQHQEAHRLREDSVETTGVGDLTAGDD